MRVSGWDHYGAVMLILCTFVGAVWLFPILLGPLGWKPAPLASAATLGIAAAVALCLRYEVTADRSAIILCRRLLGVAYKRIRIDLDNASVEVWGTGDWGDDGGWPAGHY